MCYSGWQWYNRDGVRQAHWPRDRLGCLAPVGGANRIGAHDQGFSATTQVVVLDESAVEVLVNASGLSSLCTLRVNVLSEQFEPLPGLSGSASVPLTKAGLSLPCTWHKSDESADPIATIGRGNAPERVRLQVVFDGVRPEDGALYAVYVKKATLPPATAAADPASAEPAPQPSAASAPLRSVRVKADVGGALRRFELALDVGQEVGVGKASERLAAQLGERLREEYGVAPSARISWSLGAAGGEHALGQPSRSLAEAVVGAGRGGDGVAGPLRVAVL